MSGIKLYSKEVLTLLMLALFISCDSYKYKELGEGVYAEFNTSKGLVVAKLFIEDKPLTTSNFISLSEGTNRLVSDSLLDLRYYDSTYFHRVIPNFIVQGGDPTATGLGHPGYKFIDEFVYISEAEVKYKHDKKGVLSMANSGANSNGSQFFMTHKPTPWLDGKHSVFGEVKIGLDVLDSIVQMDTLYSVNIIRQGKEAKAFDAPTVFSKTLSDYDSIAKSKAQAYQSKKDAFMEQMNYSESVLSPKGVRVFTKIEGSGEEVSSNKEVSIHYVGYLEDGTVFDSSYKRNKPLTIRMDVDPLITGWTEGIRGLQEGSEVILFIPYYLAYGEEGRPPVIPAKADLIFDIKIVNIAK